METEGANRGGNRESSSTLIVELSAITPGTREVSIDVLVKKRVVSTLR